MVAPRAGKDYPASYAQFRAWFSEDFKCVDYLDWLRWPALARGIHLPEVSELARLSGARTAGGGATGALEGSQRPRARSFTARALP